MAKTKATRKHNMHSEQDVEEDLTAHSLELSFRERRRLSLAKDRYTATDHDNFMSAALTVRDRLFKRWIKTQQGYHKSNRKRVYYLSMEFLIGRLLNHCVSNLSIEEPLRKALSAYGLKYEDLCEQEHDAALGNGGLGRLAACFMDSMATLGLPAIGYGIFYNYGIFQQKIVNGHQMEVPDKWLSLGTPWAIGRPEYTIRVRFYGRTEHRTDDQGRLRVKWTGTDAVLAMPFDFPVAGYRNGVVNTLRLWSAKGTEELDLKDFNKGNYMQAYDRKILSENITKVLYPEDSMIAGRELRLKQEYFFCAASLADILRRFKAHNADLHELPKKVVIQLNDTHPSLAVPELMRILLDEEGLEWDEAWEITRGCFAYTNHTLLPEALETWRIPILGKLLPRHLEIIYEINGRFLRDVADRFVGDIDRMRRMSLIDEGEPQRVRMSHLSIVGSLSVNGVSALHSDLLTKTLFKDFHQMYPERFNNKTNGVTPRRWILEANPRLSSLLTESIGEHWINDLSDIKRILPLKEDAAFRDAWREVKRANKCDFATYIAQKSGLAVDPQSIFDVQIKRIHEYKRQVMFALYLIHHYLRIKTDPGGDYTPRTAIFGGKAAPGYGAAKLIIKFINSIAEVINGDPTVSDRLKVIFLEDYRVSLAQRVIPAADLSEQISTAGYEASGTGNMKFMMNGTLTIGTLDGANVEIHEEVGDKNMFLFGLKADEVRRLKAEGYSPGSRLERSAELQRVLKLVISDFFSNKETGLFMPLMDSLMRYDTYMVFADFDDYLTAQEDAENRYRDQTAWTKSSILNVARSARFSSDRTIRDYAREIWDVPCRGT
ncbi:MAG: glycogen/starch/alpha-glucan phosphorylase [Elusimicrobiota bacterium]